MITSTTDAFSKKQKKEEGFPTKASSDEQKAPTPVSVVPVSSEPISTSSAKDAEVAIDKAAEIPRESSGVPETSKLDDPNVIDLAQKKHKKHHHHKKGKK